MKTAPAPLYRDPIFDGAADPVVVWNRAEGTWWMLYTQRRASVDAPALAYCYGTAVGVATSGDNGQTWVYRGTLDLAFERGHNTFWAPDVVSFQGVYHLFPTYISGVRVHGGGGARMAHYTSTNLWDWKFEGLLVLGSDGVIDATLFQMPGGEWRMWYKDGSRGGALMMARSDDLRHWHPAAEPAIAGSAQEGPKVFRFGDWYWLLTDEWAGMRVYRSDDCDAWERQGMILDKASSRPEDTPSGAHGDVVVVGETAYVFYFTHPGRTAHAREPRDEHDVLPYPLRRSSVQVAELKIRDGTLTCDRDKPFDFHLPDPGTDQR